MNWLREQSKSPPLGRFLSPGSNGIARRKMATTIRNRDMGRVKKMKELP